MRLYRRFAFAASARPLTVLSEGVPSIFLPVRTSRLTPALRRLWRQPPLLL